MGRYTIIHPYKGENYEFVCEAQPGSVRVYLTPGHSRAIYHDGDHERAAHLLAEQILLDLECNRQR